MIKKVTIRHLAGFFLLTAFLAASAPVAGAVEKFDRGMSHRETPVFMPRGQLMFGGTVSYRDFNFYDYTFLILNDINIDAYTLSVAPNVYYSFAKNMAVGVKFSYKRTLARVDETNLSLSDDLSFGISDFYALQHTYYGSLSYRYYIPIGKSKIFGIFSDISLNFGAGQGKSLNGAGPDMSGTYQRILDVGIDVIPGIAVFVTNEMCVEASVGILGLEWKRISQTTNQVYEGNYETSKANFKLNLLSINIGVNFVLPILNDKPAASSKTR
ncbi:MAG TPA: hypothetical protein IAC04_06535 [Candidatus Coprenecus stercoravium]|uniref:Outer membrane protein beta-barrel domain-containing protein n=1 Tax=Candidatus Coprenecus stercoravium TaxID=2840735 RepID=A0A9D2GRW2_9BACT|nr:hypothetical protein [Candidatus Coprenecus stercoravium]